MKIRKVEASAGPTNSDRANLDIKRAQPGVANRHAVSVAARVVQDMVGPDHRALEEDVVRVGGEVGEHQTAVGERNQGVRLWMLSLTTNGSLKVSESSWLSGSTSENVGSPNRKLAYAAVIQDEKFTT